MSTILCAIAKHNLDTTYLETTAKEAIRRLDTLVLGRTVDNINGSITKSAGGWEYYISEGTMQDAPIPNDEKIIPNIDFNGPYCLFPNIYKECLVISTIYRYSLIYQNYSLDWFNKFRKELYELLKLFGSDEVIYLCDNGRPLTKYLDMVESIDNTSYQKIKETLLEDFGEPVTDFSKLEYEALNYETIAEYFLDDFRDFK